MKDDALETTGWCSLKQIGRNRENSIYSVPIMNGNRRGSDSYPIKLDRIIEEKFDFSNDDLLVPIRFYPLFLLISILTFANRITFRESVRTL